MLVKLFGNIMMPNLLRCSVAFAIGFNMHQGSLCQSETTASSSETRLVLKSVLEDLSSIFNVEFYYSDNTLPMGKTIDNYGNSGSLLDILNNLSSQELFNFNAYGDKFILTKFRKTNETDRISGDVKPLDKSNIQKNDAGILSEKHAGKDSIHAKMDLNSTAKSAEQKDTLISDTLTEQTVQSGSEALTTESDRSKSISDPTGFSDKLVQGMQRINKISVMRISPKHFDNLDRASYSPDTTRSPLRTTYKTNSNIHRSDRGKVKAKNIRQLSKSNIQFYIHAISVATKGSGFNLALLPVLKIKKHSISAGPKFTLHNGRFLWHSSNIDARQIGIYASYKFYPFNNLYIKNAYFNVECQYVKIQDIYYADSRSISENLEYSMGFGYDVHLFNPLYLITSLSFGQLDQSNINMWREDQNGQFSLPTFCITLGFGFDF